MKKNIKNIYVGNDYTRRDGYNAVDAKLAEYEKKGYNVARCKAIDGRCKEAKRLEIVNIIAYQSSNWARKSGSRKIVACAWKNI